MLNGMRDRVVVQVDGQLKTGRDVIIGALLGAEEFGFATAPLVVSGCIMMRVCHLDTCPVGVATQNPELRARFTGKPEFVVNFFEFLAQEVREYLAELGFRSLDEAIGHAELLDVDRAVEHWKADGLDLTPDPRRARRSPTTSRGATARRRTTSSTSTSTSQLIARGAGRRSSTAAASTIDLPIRNTERAVGTMLGHEVTVAPRRERASDRHHRRHPHRLGRPVARRVPARAASRCVSRATRNDYVGKGLSGGQIIVRPPRDSVFAAERNVIAGNVIGYGATQGSMFLRGIVGERFLVRNSGATAVVEGVGDHALEYMTGGLAVILGATGPQPRRRHVRRHRLRATTCDRERVNRESLASGELELLPLGSADVEIVRDLLEQHLDETDSPLAAALLENFDDDARPIHQGAAARLRGGAAHPPDAQSTRGSTPTATSSGAASWR